MGIEVTFNPDLALRNYDKFLSGEREKEECIPENIIEGQEYNFLKKGQRLYWFNDEEKFDYGELPLLETDGNENLSRPKASIKIIEATHFLKNGEVWTKGIYKVIEIFNNKQEIYFEGLARVKK
ncbi:MAG: hypothetical protein N4A38_05310 [Candidatus Gracilibacteria bacterium]|nr:hypothetical protein [Candidatus Gracilibacteria bacterium]